ncbi:hypothetical protein CHCC20375_3128 [Bacillus licheniformis]|nr:hypothetical protein CHCC20375_3128 [Bacillus licheniformis]TWK89021.1 hypothetical protein CHCC20331_1423 [Bacillus paralicheniformis]
MEGLFADFSGLNKKYPLVLQRADVGFFGSPYHNLSAQIRYDE